MKRNILSVLAAAIISTSMAVSVYAVDTAAGAVGNIGAAGINQQGAVMGDRGTPNATGTPANAVGTPANAVGTPANNVNAPNPNAAPNNPSGVTNTPGLGRNGETGRHNTDGTRTRPNEGQRDTTPGRVTPQGRQQDSTPRRSSRANRANRANQMNNQVEDRIADGGHIADYLVDEHQGQNKNQQGFAKIDSNAYIVQDGEDLWVVSGKFRAKLDVLIYSSHEDLQDLLGKYDGKFEAPRHETAHGEMLPVHHGNEGAASIPILK